MASLRSNRSFIVGLAILTCGGEGWLRRLAITNDYFQ
jgi:hypothetical protein